MIQLSSDISSAWEGHLQEEDGPEDRNGLFEQVHLFCVVCVTDAAPLKCGNSKPA